MRNTVKLLAFSYRLAFAHPLAFRTLRTCININQSKYKIRHPNVFINVKTYSTKPKNLENIEDRVLSICKAYEGLNTKQSCSSLLLKRNFSHDAPSSLAIIEKRVLLNLKLYDKINPDKITLDSNFITDLGLDSLDMVEVVMAIEDEFEFEIPDVDAEKFNTPRDIIRYVGDKKDVYE